MAENDWKLTKIQLSPSWSPQQAFFLQLLRNATVDSRDHWCVEKTAIQCNSMYFNHRKQLKTHKDTPDPLCSLSSYNCSGTRRSIPAVFGASKRLQFGVIVRTLTTENDWKLTKIQLSPSWSPQQPFFLQLLRNAMVDSRGHWCIGKTAIQCNSTYFNHRKRFWTHKDMAGHTLPHSHPYNWRVRERIGSWSRVRLRLISRAWYPVSVQLTSGSKSQNECNGASTV
jgi:hypothetical protein